MGLHTSLALDAHGNSHISHYDFINHRLKLSDAGIHLASPMGGETWPVGATRTIAWKGVGAVDLSLSVDGGNSFEVIKSSVFGGSDPTGGAVDIRVPHSPSRFCLIRAERTSPFSPSESDSFFTIEASIALLTMTVSPSPAGGNSLAWTTDPGPEDLGGYRLDRGRDASWETIVPLTKEPSFHDIGGQFGDRYRLFAQNGLGEEFYLGEASDGNVPSFGGKLVAWPVPFRSGELNVSFGTVSIGGVAVPTVVAVYDVAGRRVRTIARGTFSGAVRRTAWDGRDESGNLVASGIYFIRATSGQTQQTRKLVIVR